MWMQYGPWLAQPRDLSLFTRPRILIREITSPFPRSLNAAFTEEPFLNNKSILNVLHATDDELSLRALLAILNSRFISTFYKERGVKSARRIFPKVVIKNLREFPYPYEISSSATAQLSRLTDSMSSLYQRWTTATIAHDRTIIQWQIEATDRQIDRLVYELYGLTDDEIAIVEAG